MNADNSLPLCRLGIDTYQEPVVYALAYLGSVGEVAQIGTPG